MAVGSPLICRNEVATNVALKTCFAVFSQSLGTVQSFAAYGENVKLARLLE